MIFDSALNQDVEQVLLKFESTWTFDVHDLRKPSAEVVLQKLIAACDPGRQERLAEEFFGVGPLGPLIVESEVTEILVNGPNDIYFERDGAFTRWPDSFRHDITFKNFVERLCRDAGTKVDLAQPFANARWNGFRVHICTAISNVSYHLSLRRMAAHTRTLDSLIDQGWCLPEEGELLRGLLTERKNVLVIGPTGSGKTTVLGCLLKELAPCERTIVIEDTDELPLPNSSSTKLLARPELSTELGAIDLGELVRQSLRMRPLRLVVGEVRGGEAKDLLLALATGHSGSWGTMHASDARQALFRLEMLIQLGAPQWNLAAIRQLLQLSVDAIVVCASEHGKRRLGGVYKLAALESFGFLLEELTPARRQMIHAG